MEDEVVISGVGGRFPQCDNLQDYRDKLLQNLHLLTDLSSGEMQQKYTAESPPLGNAPTIRSSGSINRREKFDHTFFGMHTRLAAATDTVTHLILETALEAVIDAGYSPKDLQGTNTAVFMGYHCNESSRNVMGASEDGLSIMGINAAMAANRVSYWLDLKGTSFTHNTQLVSGMQSLDMAFQALARGECERAIVGAAALTCWEELTAQYDGLGWISRTGTCKPFDRAADGSVRSDSVVVMFLERRRTARRAYAEVVHSASALFSEACQSGLPNIERRVIGNILRDFYRECGVDPERIAYVEADGWGVSDVDEAEVGALDDVIASRRKHPLLIGSVKGNIGTTEAASGLASVCKALVALESGTIPATLNHINPNPRIAGIAQGRMQVVTKNTPLAPGLVAVNSLGFGGYLGHVLLKPNSREKKSLIPAAGTAAAETIPRLLLLSGRTTEGLESIMKLAEANAMDPEYVHLVHSVFSSNIAGHVHRGYSIVPRADPSKPAQTQFYSGQKRPVWFIYSGMGSQWAGMGADLLRVPVFAAAVERCHEVLLPHGLDLKHIITTTDATIFDNVLNAFVGIAAVQIGLTDVLRSVGVEPVGMVGHSVGELGCAYADGCLTAEQTIMAAYARGVASNEADLVPGMMAAVGLGHLSVKAMLPESIEIACHNSASSCTLSGPAADMNVFVEKLKDQGFFARAVNVSNIAYHSRYIRPAAPRLLELLKGVILEPKKRSSRWISTSVQPAQAGDYDAQYATAQYFTNNLLSSVYFEESCHEVDDDALAIEIAPHGLLQAILKRSLSEDAVNVALTKRGEPGVTQLLGAFGRLYMEGLNPDVAKLYPPVATPVCRDTKSLSPLATWDHSETWPILSVSEAAEGTINTELLVPLALTSPELSHLAHCTWNGHALLSPATCLSLVLSLVTNNAPEGRTIVLDNIIFYDSVVVPEEGDDEVDVVLHTGTGRFELSVRGRLVCSGRSAAITEQDEDPVGPDVAVPQEDRVLYDADDLYEELGRRGLQCGGALRGIMSLQMGSAAVLGSASYDADKECVTALELETLMQVAALQQYGGRRVLHVPKRIQKVVMNPSKALPAGSTATLRHDAIRRRLCLHSPRGRLDVLQADMRAVPLPPTLAPILVHSRAFLSLTEGAATDLTHLCSLALQVAAQQVRGPVLVASVPARGSSASSALHAAVDSVAREQLTDLHVRVESVADVGDTAALVVSDAAGLQAATAAARRQRGMVLAELPKGFTAPADLKQLLSVEQGGRRYALLKYSVDVDRSSEVLLAADQLDVTLTRLALCHAAKEVYVVFREVAPQAVAGLVRTLSAAPGSGRAHFVFLEKASPAFALDAPVYAAQLRLGLRVNMLRGERWGWEYRVHVAKLDAGSESGRGARQDRFIMDALKVTYLGVHQRRDAEDADDGRPELLDYAGVRPDGTRVMGVCVTSVGSLQPDPVLAWTVPSAWKDQAAATVPLVYATAALAVHEQLEVRRGKRVLVVDGASPLGLASISLLLRVGCRVVATAKNATEAAALRAQFRDGLDTVVGSTVQDCASRLSARARSKTCVDAVLCQGGSDVFDCVMDLVETNGSVVHVGDGLTDGSSLGMLVFLKSCSARSVSWDWPLKAREETKRFVRDTVQAAIADGTVQPLRRSTAPPGAVAESRRVVSAEGAAAAPLVDADRSCLVLGPAAKAVTLAEWLLSVGAREVRVVPSTSRAWLAPHLALLAQHYGATVRAMPPAEPQQLIKALGLPVGLVLALDVPAARVQALDAASRVPGCALAVLVEAALDMPALGDVVRRRKAAGFAGVVASVGGLHADVRAVPMGRVLLCAKDPAVHAVEVMQVGSGSDRDEGEDTSAAGLAELLPGSLEALERLGRSLRNDVHHALLPSLIGGAASRRNREVPAVFLVAGLCDSPARELGPVARCMSVSAVAVSPPRAASTVEQAADAVAEAVLRAQPCGPYTVAGRGWGGCVALEAARRLARSADCYVTALLLDSSPDVLKPALNPLRSHASGMPAALLKYLLKLDPEIEQRVNRTAGWSAQVRVALGREDAVVEDALDCVLRRVQGLIDYRPAPRSPQDHKVAVTLVSNQPAHLKSATLSEVLLELDTFALDAPVEDVLAVAQRSARAISAGVHVGRTPMLGQHSPLLASR